MRSVAASWAVLGVVVAASACTVNPSPRVTTPVPSPPTVTSSTKLSTERADSLEAELTSSDPTRVSSVLAEPVAKAWTKTSGGLFDPGATLEIDPATVRERGDLLEVTATSTSPGEGSTTWVLTLVKEGADWKLLGTRSGS